MFNIGSGELVVIAVVALLVLGPKGLPELARGLGKFMREFRRHTDDVRSVVEREFYRLDSEVPLDTPGPSIHRAASLDEAPLDPLPVPEEYGPSQLTAGLSAERPQAVAAAAPPTPPAPPTAGAAADAPAEAEPPLGAGPLQRG